MNKLFSSDPQLEKSLLVEIRDGIKHFLKTNPDPEASFNKLIISKPKSLRFSSQVRLRILHRQFSTGNFPGLPVIVRSARFLYGRYRSIRNILPDNS